MNKNEETKNLIITRNVVEEIYNTTYKLKFNTHECTYLEEPFSKTTLQSIQNKEYFGWDSQICFLLTPLYETAILNRGIVIFENNNELGNYSWIEIFYHNKWYSFDPCSNVIYEKELFDKLYKVKIICSFTSDEIRAKLIYNLFFPDQMSNKGYKNIIKNQIYQLNPIKGIILPGHNIEDLTYGASFAYTLKKSHNTISSLKAEYLGGSKRLFY